jgi:hypothetical protein
MSLNAHLTVLNNEPEHFPPNIQDETSKRMSQNHPYLPVLEGELGA